MSIRPFNKYMEKTNLQILIDAVGVAQKRGAYSLDEVEVILGAIRFFIPKEIKEEKVNTESVAQDSVTEEKSEK